MRWEAEYEPNPTSTWQARAALEQALARADVDRAVIADALLVLSELVSNAVRHARTELTITATIEGGTLRLEVFDRDSRPPALLGLDEESTGGRGLHIVAGVARDWGWNTADGEGGAGKVVWAELSATPAAEPPS